MKKIIAALIVFLLIGGGSWYAYNYYFGGTSYYTEIQETGKATEDIDTRGQKYTTYHYEQKAYDEDGNQTLQKMNEVREDPLRIGAYLKLTVNERKGVLSWEEVSEKEVPEKALDKIKNDSN
ncbi:YxeA family protein [Enterococcus sp. LJL128]|uniref:YxeA family protein n=1 Tax=Enterococcus sp. LJL51 TaxID=3416656 RepID=UPI003CF523F3